MRKIYQTVSNMAATTWFSIVISVVNEQFVCILVRLFTGDETIPDKVDKSESQGLSSTGCGEVSCKQPPCDHDAGQMPNVCECISSQVDPISEIGQIETQPLDVSTATQRTNEFTQPMDSHSSRQVSNNCMLPMAVASTPASTFPGLDITPITRQASSMCTQSFVGGSCWDNSFNCVQPVFSSYSPRVSPSIQRATGHTINYVIPPCPQNSQISCGIGNPSDNSGSHQACNRDYELANGEFFKNMPHFAEYPIYGEDVSEPRIFEKIGNSVKMEWNHADQLEDEHGSFISICETDEKGISFENLDQEQSAKVDFLSLESGDGHLLQMPQCKQGDNRQCTSATKECNLDGRLHEKYTSNKVEDGNGCFSSFENSLKMSTCEQSNTNRQCTPKSVAITGCNLDERFHKTVTSKDDIGHFTSSKENFPENSNDISQKSDGKRNYIKEIILHDNPWCYTHHIADGLVCASRCDISLLEILMRYFRMHPYNMDPVVPSGHRASAPRVNFGEFLPTSNAAVSSGHHIPPNVCARTYLDQIGRNCHTYANFPMRNVADRNRFAGAGFHYLEDGDRVRCRECEGRLNEFRPDDDPIDQHIINFPYCPLVKRLCAEEYINRVMNRADVVVKELHKLFDEFWIKEWLTHFSRTNMNGYSMIRAEAENCMFPGGLDRNRLAANLLAIPLRLPDMGTDVLMVHNTGQEDVSTSVYNGATGQSIGASRGERVDGHNIGASGGERPDEHNIGASGGERPDEHNIGASGGERPVEHNIGASGGERPVEHNIGASGGERPVEQNMRAPQGERTVGYKIMVSQGERNTEYSLRASRSERATGHSMRASRDERTTGHSMRASRDERTTGHSMRASRDERTTGHSMRASRDERTTGHSMRASRDERTTGHSMRASRDERTTGHSMRASRDERTTGHSMTASRDERATGHSMRASRDERATGHSMRASRDERTTGHSMTASRDERATGHSMRASRDERATGHSMRASRDERTTGHSMTASRDERATGHSMRASRDERATGHSMRASRDERATGHSMRASRDERATGHSMRASRDERATGHSMRASRDERATGHSMTASRDERATGHSMRASRDERATGHSMTASRDERATGHSLDVPNNAVRSYAANPLRNSVPYHVHTYGRTGREDTGRGKPDLGTANAREELVEPAANVLPMEWLPQQETRDGHGSGQPETLEAVPGEVFATDTARSSSDAAGNNNTAEFNHDGEVHNMAWQGEMSTHTRTEVPSMDNIASGQIPAIPNSNFDIGMTSIEDVPYPLHVHGQIDGDTGTGVPDLDTANAMSGDIERDEEEMMEPPVDVQPTESLPQQETNDPVCFAEEIVCSRGYERDAVRHAIRQLETRGNENPTASDVLCELMDTDFHPLLIAADDNQTADRADPEINFPRDQIIHGFFLCLVISLVFVLFDFA